MDHDADDAQTRALADIFLGRVGGTVAHQYGRAIGEVLAVRPARITLAMHLARLLRLDEVTFGSPSPSGTRDR